MAWYDKYDPVKHVQRIRGKVYKLQDHLEEFSDSLDIASIWFHGEDIQIGYSYTFPLYSEDTQKYLSPIVDAVLSQTDLAEAILKEPQYYPLAMNFFNTAKNKHVWGLMDTRDSLPELKMTTQEATQFLSDYFQIPITSLSDVEFSYIQQSNEANQILETRYYLLEFLERVSADYQDVSTGAVTPYPCPAYNAITTALDYQILFNYSLVDYFVYTPAWDTGLSIADYDFYLTDISHLGNMDYQGILWFIDIKAVHKTSFVEISFQDRLWQKAQQNLSFREKVAFTFNVDGVAKEFIFGTVVPGYTDYTDVFVFNLDISPDLAYLPLIPIMVGREFLDEDFDEPGLPTLYKDTEALTKSLRLDHSLLREAVKGLSNSNELLGAYMFFGANLLSRNPMELDYLTKYFTKIHTEFLAKHPYYEHFMDWHYMLEITQGLLDEESAKNSAFHHYFNIGKMTISTESIPFPVDYRNLPELADLDKQDPLVAAFYKEYFQPKVWSPANQKYEPLTYKVQYLDFISDNFVVATVYGQTEFGYVQLPDYFLCKRTGTTWKKYTIHNPILMIRTGSQEIQRLDPITIWDLLQRNATEFRIPIQHELLRGYTTAQRNELITHTMCINVMAVKFQYINWYATDEFRDFVNVVSVIVTIWTLGTTSSFWIWLRGLLIAIVAAKAGAWVAKKVGGDLGVALGFITNMVILYYGGGLASTSSSTTFMEASVQNAAIAADSLSKIHSIKIQEQMDKLRRETAMFDKNYKEAMEIIEDAKDELLKGSGIKYELSQLIDELDYIYESPDDFLYRTTQMKNPGVLLLQEANTYVARHLQLPDYLSQTNIAT